MRIIYLAGPVDVLHQDHPGENWREMATDMLLAHNLASFNPIYAYGYLDNNVPELVKSAIAKANRSMIENSFGMLAVLDTGLSFGTIREIEYAKMNDITVHVVSRRDLTPHFESHDLLIFSTLKEAVDEFAVAAS